MCFHTFCNTGTMSQSEPISDSLLRVLRYVVLVEDGGSRLSERSIDAFAEALPPSIIRVPIGATVLPSVSMLNVLHDPADSTVAYMKKVGWVLTDPTHHVVVTEVGRAVVKATTDRGSDNDEGVVIFSPDDPLNYAKLTRAFVDAGAGMLVDPYFMDAQIDWLYRDTGIEKVLFCRKPVSLGTLELFLGGVQYRGDRTIELRYLPPKSLHDRYVVGADHSVSMLGASLNGLRKNFTALVKLPSSVTKTVRDQIYSSWDQATPIEPIKDIESAPTIKEAEK